MVSFCQVFGRVIVNESLLRIEIIVLIMEMCTQTESRKAKDNKKYKRDKNLSSKQEKGILSREKT